MTYETKRNVIAQRGLKPIPATLLVRQRHAELGDDDAGRANSQLVGLGYRSITQALERRIQLVGLLGKLLIVLKRHEEHVANLSDKEWQELHAHVQRSTERLRRAFAPDHFNYAFLQNQDRHVHLHVIPRYATERVVLGVRFEDPDYPGHYAAPGPERRLSPGALEALKQLLTSSAYVGGETGDQLGPYTAPAPPAPVGMGLLALFGLRRPGCCSRVVREYIFISACS